MMNELSAHESLSANAVKLYRNLIEQKCLIRTCCAAITDVHDSTNFNTLAEQDRSNDTKLMVGIETMDTHNEKMRMKTERLNIQHLLQMCYRIAQNDALLVELMNCLDDV